MKWNGISIATLGMAASALLLGPARAQDTAVYFRVVSPTTTVITAFSADGTMVWSNAAVDVTCRVQRATSLGGVSNWSDYSEQTITSAVMTLRLFDPNPPTNMVLIPAGSNSGTDPDNGSYIVTVGAFFMDKYLVTKAQWDTVCTWAVTNGYSLASGTGKGSNHPVFEVNWYECVKWCNARSEMEGRPVCYRVAGSVYRSGLDTTTTCDTNVAGYRLPTEAEWEYAARGGLTSMRFPWGNTIQHARANYFSSVSWNYDTSSTRYHHPSYCGDWVWPFTSPVGSFAPNSYGLYDMTGNMSEWCWERLSPGYDSVRMARGGSWDSTASDCKIATRLQRDPGYSTYNTVSFRTVLTTRQAPHTTAPANVSTFRATPGDFQVTLTWQNPADANFAGVMIQRQTGDYPLDLHAGTTVYNANGTNALDTGLTNGTCYYYKAFSYDSYSNYACGVTTSATPHAQEPTADYVVVDLSDGPSASNYPVSNVMSIPSEGWLDEHWTTKMVLRRIPAGTYTMGSPIGELGRTSDEVQHQVTLTKPFYVGVFEVTQRQWERVMGTWPSYFVNAAYRDCRPVEMVSYNAIRGSIAGAGWPADSNVDQDSFMGRLRSRTGLRFDLPTESQWEYAGRAGTTTALNSGRNLTTTTNCPNMAEVGRYLFNGGSGVTQYREASDTSVGSAKVGSYLPSAWGLYDIHGNVFEWCLDWYGLYPGTVNDPRGTPTGSDRRVSRGGSWYRDAYRCRVSDRYRYVRPEYTSSDIGFRVSLPIDETSN